MALVAADSFDVFLELDARGPTGSLSSLLDSQTNLFHSQVDQLQEIIVAQCHLTGVNPLSQEMAAGALSIKIGKRPRDFLNPKALKYMQSYFSIKDHIGKKEMREISALCGVTVSQVKNFFAGQRARVRKFVRLSREKATKLEAPEASCVEDLFHVDKSKPISEEPTGTAATNQIQKKHGITTPQNDQQVADVMSSGEAPSPSVKGESATDIDSDDKKFIDDIFTLMRREKTFTGKVKLMEWIIRIHNVAVLNWFLTKGGSTILATWLRQAAQEEQTSVLIVIFKVLCHLPLQKLLPTEMSDILQAVNKLRFYRSSDISQRARILLSRWSKQFITSQKKLLNNSDIVFRQSMNEMIGDESWQSEVDVSEGFLLTSNQEYNRQSEPREKLKLLPASSDDSSKRHVRSVLSTKMKARRKVLMVEQPDSKAADRSLHVARAVSSNNSRPMSADDIQKAKMRTMFMQSKYGKIDQSSTENNKNISCQTTGLASSTGTYQVHRHANVNSKLSSSTADKFPCENEAKVTLKKKSSTENQFEKLTNTQIKWQMPPAIKIDAEWSVAVGENSKEFEVQSQRNRRAEETFYSSLQDIPLNSKDPWDLEMNFDDSLTPEIPTEQPPDVNIPAGSSSPSLQTSAEPVLEASAGTSAPASNVAPEPDLELLEVLLKNPDLVFALTSNHGMNLQSEEMVALLDLLKSNSNELAEMVNKLSQSKGNGPPEIRHQQPEPTSLPSPTPPSDAERMAWRSELPSAANPPVMRPIFPSPSAMQFAAPPPSALPFSLTPPNILPPALNSIPSTSMSPPIQTCSSPISPSSHFSAIVTTPLLSDEDPVRQALPPNMLGPQSAESAAKPSARVAAPWSAPSAISMQAAGNWMGRANKFSDVPGSLGTSLLEQQQAPDSWTGRPYGLSEVRNIGPSSVREITPGKRTGGTYGGLSDHPNPNDRYSPYAQNYFDSHSNRSAVFSSSVPQTTTQRRDRNGSSSSSSGIMDREELGNNPVGSREVGGHGRARDKGWPRDWAAPGGSRDGNRFSGSRVWRRRDRENSGRR